MSRFDHRCMVGLEPIQQAQKAIQHVLQRLMRDEKLFFQMGEGTQAFDLLTEAYSSLTGEDIEKVRSQIVTK